MIQVTRLNGTQFYLNPFLIETLEETPDTVILLTNGKRFVVKEKAAEIRQYIKSFLKEIEVIKALGAFTGGPDV